MCCAVPVCCAAARCWLQVLGQRTEGFSGSDINTVVKDVLMQPIRLLRDATHFRKVRPAAGISTQSTAAATALAPAAAAADYSVSQSWLSARSLLQSAQFHHALQHLPYPGGR
jgi:vacuolar protein-sorting-associated protein 4